MTRGRWILIGAAGLAVVVAGVEHLAHRDAERRFQAAEEHRKRLAIRLEDVLSSHEQLKADLEQERQRSHALSQTLASLHAQLEDGERRLTEDARTVHTLQARLVQMQAQMDQLQGELVIALERQEAPASNVVEIERVIVGKTDAPSLQGRIVSVHPDWGFVVIDLGWDTVRIGDTISIFRGEQLMATARVDRVQEGLCAATVLPDWEAKAIQVNDLVRLL